MKTFSFSLPLTWYITSKEDLPNSEFEEFQKSALERFKIGYNFKMKSKESNAEEDINIVVRHE